MKETVALALVFICVVVLSTCLIGVLRRYLLGKSIVDKPNQRTMHQGEIPRGGGLIIVGFLLLANIVAAIFSDRSWTFLFFAFLSLSWAVLSWWDDLVDLKPGFRFSIQLLLISITIWGLGWVTQIEFSSTAVIYLGWLGLALTAIGLIWFTNLYNFMDGLDGLAASQAIIASITLAFWVWLAGDVWLAIVFMIVATSSYGFLLHNWHPATIFMGDVGSITLGAFFATMIVYISGRHQIPVVCSLILFSVFVVDASVTLIRRIIRREEFWLPHRSHFYQRLASLGFHHGQIAVGAVTLMIVFSLLASLGVADHDRIPYIIFLSLLIAGCSMSMVIYCERRHFRRQ